MPKLAPEMNPDQLESAVRAALKQWPQPANGKRINFRVPDAMGVNVKGLQVYVKGNSATWAMNVRSKPLEDSDAEARRMCIGLGPYSYAETNGALTYWQAVTKAKSLYHDIRRNGADPIAVRKTDKKAKRKAESKAVTFKECAAEVIKLREAGNTIKNAKALAQWGSTLETYVYGFKLPDGRIFGDEIVGTLTKHDVAAVLKPIWFTKVETARRVRMRIEAAFKYAINHDLFVGNNPATNDVIGGRDGLLGDAAKEVKHQAALPYADLPKFMIEVRAEGRMTARMLEFVILTNTRTSETRLAAWPEIDLERRTWTIPANRMKAGKEHVIPLPDGAVALLESLPRYDGCDLVFPNDAGAKKGQFKPYSENALLDLRNDMGRDAITIHGFRSTFRDWAGETTHHAREVIEHAMAHQLPDKAEAAYARGALLAKRRALMQDWAVYCGYPRANNVAQFDQNAAAA